MIDDFQLDDFELGLAIPAVETGTISRSAAVLIQAGFNSRIAAIKAVTETGAEFSTSQALQAWLTSDDVQVLSALPHWPTPETHEMWVNFARTFAPSENMVWLKRKRSPRPIDVFSLGRLTLFGMVRLCARQGVPGELISEGVATA